MENDYGAWLYTYWMCVLVSPSLYIWILPYPSLGGWLGWWAWLHNSSVILYPDWLVWTGWWAVLYYSTTNPGGVSWLVGWPGLVGVVKQLVTSSPSLIGWFGRAWWAVTNLRQSELGGTGLPLLCPWLGGMEMICLVSRWTLKKRVNAKSTRLQKMGLHCQQTTMGGARGKHMCSSSQRTLRRGHCQSTRPIWVTGGKRFWWYM